MSGYNEKDFRDLSEAAREIGEVEGAPLAERKEAAKEFYEAMRDTPEVVAERVGWVIAGNYGYGHMLRARRVVANSRMNRAAALTHMAAAMDWRCPIKGAIEGWKKLTAAQKKRLDREVMKEIKAQERAIKEEG